MKYLKIGIALIVICCLIIGYNISDKVVQATPGYSVVDITPTDRAYLTSGTWESWNTICTKATANSHSHSNCQGSISTHSTAETFTCDVGYVGFDLDSIPAGAVPVKYEIYAEQYRLWTGDYLNSDLANSYYCWYKVINDDTDVDNDDWDGIKTGGVATPLTEYLRYLDFSDTETFYTWTINPAYYDQLDSWTDANNVLWLAFSPTRRVTNSPPYKGEVGSGNSNVYLRPEHHFADPWTDEVKLRVTYLPDLTGIARPAVDPVINAAVDTDVAGNETAQSFAWQTPRCLYTGDDYGVIRVLGDSGANVTLTAKTESGTILSTITDSIRTDGDFDWRFSLPDDPAFIRIYETQHNIVSQWGRVEYDPLDSVEWLKTYSRYQSYPQYDYPLDDYRIKENERALISWKVNMTAGDQSTTGLDIFLNDQSTIPLYSANFTEINDDYYSTGNTTYDVMAFNSYMMFTPNVTQTGFKDYDGLIMNVAKNYGYTMSGFWAPLIIYNTAVVGDCHSAYYYLHDNDDDMTVSAEAFTDAFSVYITFGEYTKIIDYLPECTVQLIGNSDELISETDIYLHDGMNRADLLPLTSAGLYQVRITCSGDLCPDYQYIYDWPITVTETGIVDDTVSGNATGTSTDDWVDWLNGFLKTKGLDSESGHWLVIFIVCLAIYLAALWTKSQGAYIAAAALIVLVIAGAMIAHWINAWFIIFGAILIGLVLFGIFKKKTQGKDSEA